MRRMRMGKDYVQNSYFVGTLTEYSANEWSREAFHVKACAIRTTILYHFLLCFSVSLISYDPLTGSLETDF